MLIAATGLTGFVGMAIAKRLSREGDLRIRALVRPDGRKAALLEAAPAVEVQEGDMADIADVRRLVEGAQAVVHAAHDSLGGHQGLRFSHSGSEFRREFLDRNLRASADLLTEARLSGVCQFVNISAFSLYGRQPHEGPAITDDTASHPNSPYSALKAAVDAFCQSFDGRFPNGVSILRPCLVLGIDPDPERSTYWSMARSIQAGESMSLNGGTSTVRIEDVAEAVHLAIRKPANARGVVNLVDRYTDLAEVAEILKEKFGSKAEILAGVRRGQPERPPVCARAEAMGIRFRGREGLLEYLDALVAAARSVPPGPPAAAPV